MQSSQTGIEPQRVERDKRIPGLDGWRGIAISLVVLGHVAEQGAGSSRIALILSRLGPTGVSLFFALSGFLITTRLIEEQKRSGEISLKNFYLRRAFRLLPASSFYLSCLAVLTCLGYLAVTKLQWLGSLFFFRNYLALDFLGGGWYTAHFWSLAVEEHYYLVWPAIFMLSKGRLMPGLVSAVLVATWRMIDGTYGLIDGQGVWFYGRTDVRLDALLWGSVLAILIGREELRVALKNRYNSLAWAAAMAVYVGVKLRWPGVPFAEPLLMALILVWPVLNEGSIATSALQWKPLRWLGAISYSLYLWQQFWLVPAGISHSIGPIQSLPWNLPFLMLCATASYYCIETPGVRLGHRLIRARSKVSLPA